MQQPLERAPQKPPLKTYSDAEKKEAALSMYCTMHIVRLSTIAKMVGIPESTLIGWRDRGGWAALRDAHQIERRLDLRKTIGNPALDMQELMTATRDLIKQIKENKTSTILEKSLVLKNLFIIQSGIFDWMRMRD